MIKYYYINTKYNFSFTFKIILKMRTLRLERNRNMGRIIHWVIYADCLVGTTSLQSNVQILRYKKKNNLKKNKHCQTVYDFMTNLLK